MKKIILSTIFIIILITIFSIQFFYYEMNFKDISTSLGVFVAFIGAIFFVWQKVFSPLFSKAEEGLDYIKNLFESVEQISKEFQPNHGTSIKDSVNRIDSKLSIIEAEMTISNDNGHNPLFKCNKKGFNLAVNRSYCRLIGCSKDELMGFGWKRFTAKHGEGWQEALEEGREVTFNVTMENVKGDKIPLETHCFPILDANGEVVHYICFLTETEID